MVDAATSDKAEVMNACAARPTIRPRRWEAVSGTRGGRPPLPAAPGGASLVISRARKAT